MEEFYTKGQLLKKVEDLLQVETQENMDYLVIQKKHMEDALNHKQQILMQPQNQKSKKKNQEIQKEKSQQEAPNETQEGKEKVQVTQKKVLKKKQFPLRPQTAFHERPWRPNNPAKKSVMDKTFNKFPEYVIKQSPKVKKIKKPILENQ